MKSSKLSKPSLLEANRTYSPDGVRVGRPAHRFEVGEPPWIRPVEVHRPEVGQEPVFGENARQTIREPSAKKKGPPSYPGGVRQPPGFAAVGAHDPDLAEVRGIGFEQPALTGVECAGRRASRVDVNAIHFPSGE